jgi:hypothetical protein
MKREHFPLRSARVEIFDHHQFVAGPAVQSGGQIFSSLYIFNPRANPTASGVATSQVCYWTFPRRQPIPPC